MKTPEEIKRLGNQWALDNADETMATNSALNKGFRGGYTQCQEDMIEIFKEEIRRAFIHGQGNAQMMEAGLERDETKDYINSRMLSLNKQFDIICPKCGGDSWKFNAVKTTIKYCKCGNDF